MDKESDFESGFVPEEPDFRLFQSGSHDQLQCDLRGRLFAQFIPAGNSRARSAIGGIRVDGPADHAGPLLTLCRQTVGPGGIAENRIDGDGDDGGGAAAVHCHRR